MAGPSFCAFVDALRAAAPALPSSDLPTLYAFSQLAKAFPAQPQVKAAAEEPQLQSQARAISSQPQAKADADQAQDESSAQTLVNGLETEEDARSESKAEREVMSSSNGKAESVTDVKPESKGDTKPDAKATSKADAKAASKGSKASSRAPSSDGGLEPKSRIAAPKATSSVKVSEARFTHFHACKGFCVGYALPILATLLMPAALAAAFQGG